MAIELLRAHIENGNASGRWANGGGHCVPFVSFCAPQSIYKYIFIPYIFSEAVYSQNQCDKTTSTAARMPASHYTCVNQGVNRKAQPICANYLLVLQSSFGGWSKILIYTTASMMEKLPNKYRGFLVRSVCSTCGCLPSEEREREESRTLNFR